MKLTKRETTMIIVGFLLVAVIAYVFYFAMPQAEKQSKMAMDILNANSSLQTVKAKAASIEKLKSQVSSLQDQLNSETENIPHGSNDAIILLYLRQLADRTGLDLSVTFADKPTESGAFIRRLVAIESQTSYAKMSALLRELSKEELFNSVQVISAVYEPVETTEGPVTADEDQATSGGQTAAPAPTPTATPTDTIKARIELYFDAFKLMSDEQPSVPPLTADIKDRAENLFPN